jgi:hypothetical protein
LRSTPRTLHTVIHQAAPRTPELVAVLTQLRAGLAAVIAARLVDAGIAREAADRRGHALVVAVDAAIHEHVLAADTPDDQRARIDDVVILTTATLAADAT